MNTVLHIFILASCLQLSFPLELENTDLNPLSSNYDEVDINNDAIGGKVIEKFSQKELEKLCENSDDLVYVKQEDVTIDCKFFTQPVEEVESVVKREADNLEEEGSGDKETDNKEESDIMSHTTMAGNDIPAKTDHVEEDMTQTDPVPVSKPDETKTADHKDDDKMEKGKDEVDNSNKQEPVGNKTDDAPNEAKTKKRQDKNGNKKKKQKGIPTDDGKNKPDDDDANEDKMKKVDNNQQEQQGNKTDGATNEEKTETGEDINGNKPNKFDDDAATNEDKKKSETKHEEDKSKNEEPKAETKIKEDRTTTVKERPTTTRTTTVSTEKNVNTDAPLQVDAKNNYEENNKKSNFPSLIDESEEKETNNEQEVPQEKDPKKDAEIMQGRNLNNAPKKEENHEGPAKTQESTEGEVQKAGSKDTTILICLFVAVVIVGALAFGYNFVKKRKQRSEEVSRMEQGVSSIKRSVQNLAKTDPEPERKPLMGENGTEMVDMKKSTPEKTHIDVEVKT